MKWYYALILTHTSQILSNQQKHGSAVAAIYALSSFFFLLLAILSGGCDLVKWRNATKRAG